MALAALVSRTNQYQLKSGALNVGGKIYVYKDETDDLAEVYDEDGRILAQPLVTDSNGRTAGPMVDSDGVYRLVVQDAYGATLYTVRHMVPAGGSGGVDIRTVITSDDGSIIVTPTDHGYDISLPKASVVQATSSELNDAGPFSIYEIRKQQGTDIWLDQTTNKLMCNKGWYHCDVSVVMQNSTARNEMLVVGFSDTLEQWHGDYNLDLSYTNQRCESFSFDVYIGRDGTELSIIETQALPSGVKMFLHTFDVHTLFCGSLGGHEYTAGNGIEISDDDVISAVGYATRGNWDRSLQIDNNAHTISADFQGVAIRQQINNSPSTYKYAKVCEADINTVTWINEWSTTLQLALQSSGAYNGGKSAGIFELNLENYVQSSSQYVQKHEEDAKWLLFDGDNKSPSIVKLYLYWRDDSSSQHYELWLETANLKYYESIAAQALINFSLRNHLTSSLPIEQERNIWRFNNIGIETAKPSLPTGMTLIGSWSPSNASIKPLEDHGVFYVEYGTTTFADAEAAYLAGKTLVCREIGTTVQQTRMDDLYFLIDYLPTAGSYTGHFVFSNITGYIQTNVRLSPSATYEKVQTTMATRQEVIDTLAAEIAPDYNTVVQQRYDEDSFPIPAGTYVTYLDNTSSSVLQYLYKSKVAIERWEEATSDPLTAPEKWDKIHVSDELGKGVAYVEVTTTPFSEVLSLYNQGKFIIARSGSTNYYLIYVGTSWGAIDRFDFQGISGPVIYTWTVTSDGPAETNNWLTPPSIYYNSSIYNIAIPYNESSTYSAGDVVSRYDTLYRCNTNISVAEPWTQAHWTQTTVAAELANIRSDIPEDKVFHAVYGTTTFAEITDAVTAGKLVFLTGVTGSSDTLYSLTTYTSPRPALAIFHAVNGTTVYKAQIESGTWSTSSTTLATSADLANYQEKLTAGANITIDANNVISSTAAPQQQADWNQSDTSAPDYIKNKPDVDDVVILNYGTATLSQISTAVNAGKCVIVGRTSGGYDYYGHLTEYGSGAYTFVYKDGNHLVSMTIQPDGGDGTWSMSSVTIPAAQIQSDWTQSDSSAVDYIKNKPTIPVVPDLKPLVAGANITIVENANDVTISAAGGTQQQADWAQTVTTAVDYIKNKPDLSVYATTADLSTGLAGKQDVINDLSTIRSGAASGATAVQPADLATVATTGDYDDLSNKPHIPVVGTITL